jgi:long-chain acyl-CoA synthetase
MNVDALFRTQAQKQPRHPAILGPRDASLSYRALDEAVDSAAEALARAGVGPKSCVALHIPSGVDYIVFCYAAWRCGGCVVPVPVEGSDQEKVELCRGIAIDCVLSTGGVPPFLQTMQCAAPATLPRGATLIPLHPCRAHPAGFGEIDAAFIRFTSGTTGASKGIVLSHDTIRERIDAANEALAIEPADRVVWVLSMSYHFTVSIVGYLSFGASIVLPDNHLAQGILNSIRLHKATVFYASPVHYALLASSAGAEPVESLRLAISTAMSLDREVALAFHSRFGIPVAQALGIIEVGLAAVNLDFAAGRPEAVGRILPAYSLRLGDAGFDSGIGEVQIRGPGFLDAYYEPWQSRKEIMPDGWFRTGDLGELDEDGCLCIRGRSKDVINYMGMKFFPHEVERILESHPGVRKACVTAVPSAQFGDIPLARIVANGSPPPSKAELLEYCRHRLAEFKVPHDIEFVDRLQYTSSGKLLRRDAAPASPMTSPMTAAARSASQSIPKVS